MILQELVVSNWENTTVATVVSSVNDVFEVSKVIELLVCSFIYQSSANVTFSIFKLVRLKLIVSTLYFIVPVTASAKVHVFVTVPSS